MRRFSFAVALLVLVFGLTSVPRHLTSRPAVNPDFVHFESGHVHPACLTPSGERLLVVNTPDNRLSVFDLTGNGPTRIAEIPVGLEPVSVAARDDSTAWVVNQLSDDVSIVNLNTLHVAATGNSVESARAPAGLDASRHPRLTSERQSGRHQSLDRGG